MKITEENTVCFIFGAGCEDIYGLPLGSKFIKSILYPSQAKELYEKLNIDKTYSFE